jgi:hypothetical protein
MMNQEETMVARVNRRVTGFEQAGRTATSEQKHTKNKARELAMSIASSRASTPQGASPGFRVTGFILGFTSRTKP